MLGQLGSWVREQVQIVIRRSDQGGAIQGPTTDVGKFEQNPLLIRPGKPVHGYPEHAQKVPLTLFERVAGIIKDRVGRRAPPGYFRETEYGIVSSWQ
jgi:hypothetical protein